MYKIIGSDGKEYGPISTEQIRQWLAEGRLTAATRARAEPDGGWKPLAQFPEFASQTSAAFPPPSAGVPAAPVAAVAPRTSGLAIASLVLGILGLFCGVTALPGLICGIVAQGKIRKSNGQLSGSGLAIAGMCVSGFFLLMLPVMAGLLLPALAKAKDRAVTVRCFNNLKQLGFAAKMYAADNQDQLPPAAIWSDALSGYVDSPRVFQCALAPDSRCAYAFNQALSGKKTLGVNPRTVLFFESSAGWNGSGNATVLDSRRHSERGRRVAVVVYVDGTVERVAESQLDSLRWNP